MTLRIPPSFGPPSTVFGGITADDSLSSGIAASYPILRIKGKVWSITRGGSDPHVLMRPDGDGPVNGIDVVLLAASQYVSKVWYEHGYEEGSTNPPDCFSSTGITPDASSTKRQSPTCAACPQNKWGSRITPSGKPGKACSDSKRVAVSPLHDIANEAMGGPMLLRVPGASLNDFANYARQMKAMGYEFFAAGTKVSFDPAEAYPKLVLAPVRPLTDHEAHAVLEARQGDQVRAILAEGTEVTHEPPPTIKLPPAFNQPVTPQVAPPVAQYAPPVPPPAPPPVTPQVTPPAPPTPEQIAAANAAARAAAVPLMPAPVAPPAPVSDWGVPNAPRAPRAAPVEEVAPPPAPIQPKLKAAPAPPPVAVTAPAPSAISPDFEASLDAELDSLLSE